MIKMIRLTALFLMLLLCFTGCVTQTPPELPDDSTSDSTSEEKPSDSSENKPNDTEEENSALDPADALILAKDDMTEYVVVRDDAATASVKTMINEFSQRFWGITRANIPIRTDDKEEKVKEIIVSPLDGRDSIISDQLNCLTAPDGKGYRIVVEDEKIIVACSDDFYLDDALDLLANAIVECSDGSYGIPKDYVGKLDVPVYREEGTLYYAGEGNYTYTVNNTKQSSYETYVKNLKNDNFEEYATNQIGSCLFGTYVKDSTTGSMVVYTMFYPNTGNFRMTYGPLTYLPGNEAIPEPETKSAHPAIISIGRVAPGSTSASNGAPGNSMLIQLADGSFIVMDGGPYMGKDMEDLYKFMYDRTPAGQKPTVAMWLISHAHGDHMQLANNFLNTYDSSRINVQTVAYNFPDFASISIKNESATGMGSLVTTFKNTVDAKHPSAEHVVLHTGQKLYFPGASMDVVYTPEDYYGKGEVVDADFPWGNHTGIAVRFTVNETTFLTLGDCEVSLNKQMADQYGAALKSDVFQPTHHGVNGGQIDLYKFVDPDICLWQVDEARFKTKIPNYDFNKWLLDNSIKKRQHYTADKTAIIDC